jgi:hypothetical protein
VKPLNQFVDETKNSSLRLQIDAESLSRIALQSDDGLFQVPLLAICVLVVARARCGELPTADISVWTGATLTRHFSRDEPSRRKLDWSLQHRKRAADALVFLENIEFVVVNEAPNRRVSCTTAGLAFVAKMMRQTDEVGMLVRGLLRSYTAVEHRGLGSL